MAKTIILLSFLFLVGCSYRPVYHCDEILEILNADASDKDKIHIIKDHMKLYHYDLWKLKDDYGMCEHQEIYFLDGKWKIMWTKEFAEPEIRYHPDDMLFRRPMILNDIVPKDIPVDTFYYEGEWKIEKK